MAANLDEALDVLKTWIAREVRVTSYVGQGDDAVETMTVRGMFFPRIRPTADLVDGITGRTLDLYANPADNWPRTRQDMDEDSFRAVFYESDDTGEALSVRGAYGCYRVTLVRGGAEARILHGLKVHGNRGRAVASRAAR